MIILVTVLHPYAPHELLAKAAPALLSNPSEPPDPAFVVAPAEAQDVAVITYSINVTGQVAAVDVEGTDSQKSLKLAMIGLLDPHSESRPELFFVLKGCRTE